MKKLNLAFSLLVLSGVLMIAPLTAHARNFLRGSIDLRVAYSTLTNGTQVLVEIPRIDVHVSDDAQFCQMSVGGVAYPCLYAETPYAVNSSDCRSQEAVFDKNVSSGWYNCVPVGGIMITTESILKILNGRINAALLSNLRSKLMKRATIGKRIRPDVFATLASKESKEDTIMRYNYTHTGQAGQDFYELGEQIHDDVNPDSFHLRSRFVTPLVRF